MKRQSITEAIELVSRVRNDVDTLRALIDHESLQVGDRNVIEGSLTTIATEVWVVLRTFADLLEDVTKQE